ncbi:MAG: GerMN domain-containing protein [Clostridia bacterium]|nr:GerMN domain-containing protein [Clostridia bacterium]
MNHEMKYARRAALWCILLPLLFVLSGCVSQVTQRSMEDLSGTEIKPSMSAPWEDGWDPGTQRVTLYFLSEDGEHLSAVTREVTLQDGSSRAYAALSALLDGPQEGERGVSWPDLGTARPERLLEVSGGVATVDLPARARTLSQEELYAVRLAIADTLTEFKEISYVNVLVGGREEGLDLGATLPVGTFTRVEDMEALARYNRLYELRQSSQGVTLLTTLYFPSADGAMLLPEVRSVAYSVVSPIEFLYTLLEELGKGANHSLAAGAIPAPMQYIEEMPEITRTEDGAYRAIDIRFSAALDDALAEAGLTRGIYLAMLTDTLMGFVPGVEGIRVTIGSEVVTALSAEQTPAGVPLEFAQTLATRADFVGYAGAPATLYTQDGESGGLRRVQRVLPQERQDDPRERLAALIRLSGEDGAVCLPGGLTEADILAVHVGADAIAVNLSQNFAGALSALSHKRERSAVYAMVNTLTEGMDASRVIFFFEGEQVSALAGGLEMRGAFVRNPGMVVE